MLDHRGLKSHYFTNRAAYQRGERAVPDLPGTPFDSHPKNQILAGLVQKLNATVVSNATRVASVLQLSEDGEIALHHCQNEYERSWHIASVWRKMEMIRSGIARVQLASQDIGVSMDCIAATARNLTNTNSEEDETIAQLQESSTAIQREIADVLADSTKVAEQNEINIPMRQSGIIESRNLILQRKTTPKKSPPDVGAASDRVLGRRMTLFQCPSERKGRSEIFIRNSPDWKRKQYTLDWRMEGDSLTQT